MSRESSLITVVDGENEETTTKTTTRDAENLRNRKLMKQKLKLAAEKFNNKPLKIEWIRFAIDLGILKSKSELSSTSESKELLLSTATIDTAEDALSDAKSIAAFLKYTPGNNNNNKID